MKFVIVLVFKYTEHTIREIQNVFDTCTSITRLEINT